MSVRGGMVVRALSACTVHVPSASAQGLDVRNRHARNQALAVSSTAAIKCGGRSRRVERPHGGSRGSRWLQRRPGGRQFNVPQIAVSSPAPTFGATSAANPVNTNATSAARHGGGESLALMRGQIRRACITLKNIFDRLCVECTAYSDSICSRTFSAGNVNYARALVANE